MQARGLVKSKMGEVAWKAAFCDAAFHRKYRRIRIAAVATFSFLFRA